MARDDRIIAQIIARAWSEPAFKAQLLANPADVLRNYGIAVPNNITVRMHENTDSERHLVLPRMPDTFDVMNPIPVPIPTVFNLDPAPPATPIRGGGKKAGAKKAGARKAAARKGGRKRSR